MNHPAPIDAMTPDQERAFLRELEREDDSAARAHLAAGHPIVYRKPTTPAGHVVKRYPDGRRELVRFENGRELRVRELPPVEPFDGAL